ncbi:MAG: SDR family oxidoreductase [Actinobacteria bacterium]|nr:SDR family oxidoreductase [Actinomycetota bacterium]
MDLHGNVALTIGPAGAAVADRLAELGASVAVLDHRPAALASRIASAGGHSLALTGDHRDERSVRAAVSRLLTAWERIDIVVTGADSLAVVGPAVARYLVEAAGTSSRGVADLIVLGPAEARRPEIRLAGEAVRVELVDPVRPGVAGRVLELIGRPAFRTAERAG